MKNPPPHSTTINKMMTPKQILSLFILTAGVAMTISGLAIGIIPLLVIGIPIAALGGVLFLL